jgi:O-antigen/teichoic acid export membrane protein
LRAQELRVGTAVDTTELAAEVPRGLSLRRNFAWTFVGNVVYAACQWGMLVALAKLGSPEMVGQFALGLAICAPVMMLANLQLRSVQGTDARNEYRFGDYLALRLMTTALAFGLICLIAWLAVARWQTALVVVLVGVAKGVESISDAIYGLMLKHERLDRIAIAMILRGSGSVILFALALWLTGGVIWAVIALAAWWSSVLLTYERMTGSALLKVFGGADDPFAPSWVWKRLQRLAWLSFPLGVVMVLVSLNTNIPRYFVEHYLGEAALGYFAALGYVMVAGYTVMGALGQSATPRLAKYWVSDRAAFRRLLGKMVLLAMGIGAVGILIAALWGRPLLTLLYRRDYAQYADVFVWIMVAAAISYVSSMLGYGMTAARIFRAQVPLFATSCLGIVVACALLVKGYGLFGAAATLVVGASISALGGGGILIFQTRSARDCDEVARA